MAELLQVGSLLEGYQIQGAVRRDGLSVDYEASHPALERTVIVKELFPEALVRRLDGGGMAARAPAQQTAFEAFLARFLAQYRVLERIDHPAIVNVRECLSANGTGYAVLDYPQGGTLEQRLQEGGALPAGELTAMLSALIGGLEQVHRANLLHRDIVPDHVVIRPGGHPVLVGFGAGPRAAGGPRQAFSPASAGLALDLTAGYAPLEQYSNRGHEGPWTDIYALGALAYRCATGIVPEDAPSRAIHDELVPAVRAAKGGYGSRLLGGIDAALAMRVSERPQSLAAWRTLLSGPAEAEGPKLGARGRMGARRGARAVREASQPGQKGPNWVLPALGAMLFIAVLTGLDVGILRSADEVPAGQEMSGSAAATPPQIATPRPVEPPAVANEVAVAAEAVEALVQDAQDGDALETLPELADIAPESTAPEPEPQALLQVADIAPEPTAPEPAPEALPEVADIAPESTVREPAGSLAEESAGLPAVTQSPTPVVPKEDPPRQSANDIQVAASAAQEGVADNADGNGAKEPAAPDIIASAPRPFTVTSVPAGAAISFVDGSGPYVAGMMLAPGDYRILAQLPGHSPWRGPWPTAMARSTKK